MRQKLSWPLVNEVIYPAVAPLVVLVLLLLTIWTNFFERVENLTINWRFQTREPWDPKPDPRVVLVKIDQTSLDLLGRWPWARSIHGDFCQLAAAANVSVVGFDLLFSEPSEHKEDDKAFAEGASKVRAVVVGANFDPQDVSNKPLDYDFGKTSPFTQVEGDVSQIGGQNTVLLPVPPLIKETYFGFVEAAPDRTDGVRRSIPLLERVGDKVFPSLSLQMLCHFWNISPDKVRVRLGSDIELPTPDGVRRIPINARGEMLLNYRYYDASEALLGGLNAVAYSQLVGAMAKHFVNGEEWPKEIPTVDNKILLVGQTAVGLTDFGPSPLEAASPLVTVHLTALNNILTSDYLHIAPDWPLVLLWLAVSWGTLFYLRKRGIGFSIGMPILFAAFYMAVAEILFVGQSLLIPIVWPVFFFFLLYFGAIVLRWLEEQQSRQEIKQVFSRMLSPEVMEHLLDQPENVKMGGSERPVTIFFSDIRDYTKFSEGLKPTEVVRQLNVYFERMVACVNDCEGTLHKYIGDAIMAAWGDIAAASHGPEKDAQNAVRCALTMRRLLRELNEEREAENLTPLRFGIGMNFGPDVLVGLIGASSRSEFTVMGDAVNLASRLEGVTKEYKTDIAIGESVQALVKDKFLLRILGVIVVKGKSKPVKVYEVLDELEKPAGGWSREWVEEYTNAMDLYFSRDFKKARAGLKKCLEKRPGDFCCELYLGQCEEFLKHPPGKDWDGTQVMKTK